MYTEFKKIDMLMRSSCVITYEKKKIFFLIPINVSDMLTNKRKELIKIGIYKLL